jgi:putative FmdB family regulatory protein
MPLYDFGCGKCGLEFEVSRPLSKASDPAFCPMDGGECERVFTMPGTFVKGGSARDNGELPRPPNQQSDWSHFGHSHGPGSAGHSHGPS